MFSFAEFIVYVILQVFATWACQAAFTVYETPIMANILGGRAFLFNTYTNGLNPKAVHTITSRAGAFLVCGMIVGPVLALRILISVVVYRQLDPSLLRSPMVLHFAVSLAQQCLRVRVRYDGVRAVGIDFRGLPHSPFHALRTGATLALAPLLYGPGMELTIYLLEVIGDLLPRWPSFVEEMDAARILACPDMFSEHENLLIRIHNIKKQREAWEVPGRFLLRLAVLIFTWQMRWWSTVDLTETAPFALMMSYNLGDVVVWAHKNIYP